MPRASYVLGGELEGGGGELDVLISGVSATAQGPGWSGSLVRLGAGYEHRHYDLHGGGIDPFFGGSGEPFDDLHAVGLDATVVQAFDDRWGMLVRVGVRGAAEVGVDLLDGISWNVLAGVGHRFSDSLIVGVGVVVVGRLEDDVIVAPGVQLDWRIDEEWRLRVEGSGVELGWAPDEAWELALGARYESRRYRLGDGLADSIFEDTRIPLSLAVRYRVEDWLRLEILGGVDVYRSFEIEDEDGRNGRTVDADPGGFVGASLTLTF